MSNIQTETFLSGQGIAVDPRAIEQTLNDLWGPAAERIGGPEVENPPVTRVVLANLVVETSQSDCLRVAKALDTIVARFPCRAIIALRTDAPGREITAEVAALCHLPVPGLPQVCSERILLRAGPEAIDLLPGAIRPLLESDLPVVLWWTSNPRETESLYRDLADESTRVLLDLDEADNASLAFGLDPKINPYARDTSWFGLTSWRDLIAQCFDGAGRLGMLTRITEVEVVALNKRESKTPPRPAAWLVAWLAGQLGWTLEQVSDESLRRLVTFRSGSGPVVVSIRSEIDPEIDDPRIVDVSITSKDDEGDSRFQICRMPRDCPGLQLTTYSPHTCELPRFVEFPISDVAHRISAGLESARHDPPFVKALPIALRLLQD